ncbi:hypothetical protein SAY86_000685 [Trapa natans]|uniref:Uncharacterized protein n=1 Tax=Trapa natans TaxID=22666 RepID=A0AAN7MCH0_TRANT|nr:hypothetical protein SAY86_000685 [Trapa natans]
MESSNGSRTAESTVFHGDGVAPTFRASGLESPRWCIVKKMPVVEHSFEQDEGTTSSSDLHGGRGRCTNIN